MKRKVLSSMLAIGLVLQMIPAGVWAETGEDISEEMETVTITEETESKEENTEEQQNSKKNINESDSAGVVKNKTEEDTDKEERGADSMSEKDGDTEKDEVVELNRENDEPQNLIRSGKCGENLIWNFDKESGILYIQGSGDMYDYDYSYDPAPWSYNDRIIEIQMSDQITSIGSSAFANCCNLEKITLSKKIKRIGDFAFFNCNRLKYINLPEGLETIEDAAFTYCYSLTNLEIPSTVVELDEPFLIWPPIGYHLESVSILADFTTIERWFSECYYLKCIELPASVTSIDYGAFEHCNILTDVYYCGTPEMWDKVIIAGLNENLENATIHFNHKKGSPISARDREGELISEGICGENMTWKFDRYTGLLKIRGSGEMYDITEDNPMWSDYRAYIKEIEIDEGVTSIGKNAFKETSMAYFDMKLPSSIKTIGDDAFFSSLISGIEMPEIMESIGAEAFLGCENLRNIRIPYGITRIENATFAVGDYLKTVEIPATVSSIGSEAFSLYIETIYFGGTFEKWKTLRNGGLNGALRTATVYCSDILTGIMDYRGSIPWTFEYRTRKLSLVNNLQPDQLVYVAAYDEDGRFLNVGTMNTAGKSVVIPKNSASSRLFLMDENNQPLCAAETVFDETVI